MPGTAEPPSSRGLPLRDNYGAGDRAGLNHLRGDLLRRPDLDKIVNPPTDCAWRTALNRRVRVTSHQAIIALVTFIQAQTWIIESKPFQKKCPRQRASARNSSSRPLPVTNRSIIVCPVSPCSLSAS